MLCYAFCMEVASYGSPLSSGISTSVYSFPRTFTRPRFCVPPSHMPFRCLRSSLPILIQCATAGIIYTIAEALRRSANDTC